MKLLHRLLTSRRWILSGCMLGLFSSLAMACYGLTRNTETLGGDEFFYLLLARFPGESALVQGTSEAHTIIHSIVYGLLSWKDADVLTFRFLKLATVLVSSGLLSFGFWSWIKNQKDLFHPSAIMNLPVLMVTVGVGSLYTYSFDLPGLSYNSLTQFFLISASGFLFYGLSEKKNLRWLAVAGFLVGFGFFSKVPSGVLFLGLAGVFILLHKKALLDRLGFFLMGWCLALGVYWTAIQDFSIWWTHLQEGMRNILIAMPTYKPSDRIGQYLQDFIRAFAIAFLYFGPVYFGVYRLMQSQKQLKRNQIFLGVLALAIIFAGECVLLRKYLPGRVFDSWSRPFLILLALQIVILATIPRARKDLQGVWVAPFLFLFFAPFAGSFGTAVNIMGHIAIGLAPWFALLWLTACLAGRYFRAEVATLALAFTLLSACGQLALDSFSSKAYHLTAYTDRLSSNPWLARMKFTPERREQLEKIQKAMFAAHYRPGDPIVEWGAVMSIYPYMMGGPSPGNPTYTRRENQMCISLKNSKLNLSSTYLLISTWSGNKDGIIGSSVQKCWREAGIHFPENYKVAGKLAATTCCDGEASKLTIYAPKNR